MKKALGLRLDPSVKETPSYVSFDQDQVWVGKIESGRFQVPVAFFTDTTIPLDDLLEFWATALTDFEERFDRLIWHVAASVLESHNGLTTGRFRIGQAEELLPYLVPDRVHFWERDLFCIELSPYRPLEHLGLSLRFFLNCDWYPVATSWDRDQPRYRPKKAPNQSPDPTRFARGSS